VSAEDVHVLPLHDLLEHNSDSPECMCDPQVEIVGASLLIIHNSYDGREEEEPQESEDASPE
jgi:hypothetical protein